MPEPDRSPRSARWRPRRRNRRARATTGDGVRIDGDADHSWWADRDSLDQLVNPKKRGAAAREQGANSAFAPGGPEASWNPGEEPPRPRSDERREAISATPRSHWSPEDVFAWTSSEEPAPSTEPTPWQVLGLSSDASWTEITTRHRQLVKQHHPDRHSASGAAAQAHAERVMSEINAAFSDLRRIYRLTGET